MMDLVKIDDEVITSDEFVKILKLSGRFDGLMEDVVKDKLAVHAAKRRGIKITDGELQDRADQLRRVWGLHRAADANRWLDARGLTLEDLEQFITEMLYHEKMMEKVGRRFGDRGILQSEFAEVRQHRGQPHRGRLRRQGARD